MGLILVAVGAGASSSSSKGDHTASEHDKMYNISVLVYIYPFWYPLLPVDAKRWHCVGLFTVAHSATHVMHTAATPTHNLKTEHHQETLKYRFKISGAV